MAEEANLGQRSAVCGHNNNVVVMLSENCRFSAHCVASLEIVERRCGEVQKR
jgi:hypothetical protein